MDCNPMLIDTEIQETLNKQADPRKTPADYSAFGITGNVLRALEDARIEPLSEGKVEKQKKATDMLGDFVRDTFGTVGLTREELMIMVLAWEQNQDIGQLRGLLARWAPVEATAQHIQKLEAENGTLSRSLIASQSEVKEVSLKLETLKDELDHFKTQSQLSLGSLTTLVDNLTKHRDANQQAMQNQIQELKKTVQLQKQQLTNIIPEMQKLRETDKASWHIEMRKSMENYVEYLEETARRVGRECTLETDAVERECLYGIMDVERRCMGEINDIQGHCEEFHLKAEELLGSQLELFDTQRSMLESIAMRLLTPSGTISASTTPSPEVHTQIQPDRSPDDVPY